MIFITNEIHISDSELEFEFVRSTGPGGQNVNKVNSKARLRWNFEACPNLPDPVRARFLLRFGARLTSEGEILITSDRFRDRRRNQEDCLEKLREMLLLVALAPKPRKKTRPSRAAKAQRRDSKRHQGEKKRGRGRGNWAD